MPKRKWDDYDKRNCDRITKQIRKLERKIKRTNNKINKSSRSSSSNELSPRHPSESQSITKKDCHKEKEVNLLEKSSEYDFYGPGIDTPPPQEENRRQSIGSVILTIPQIIDAMVDINEQPTNAINVPLPNAVDLSLQVTHSGSLDTAPSVKSLDDYPSYGKVGPSEIASDPKTLELDSDLMKILEPINVSEFGPEIQKDLAKQLNHIVTNGLTKDKQKELSDKYLIPSNCQLMRYPSLNPEIRAFLTERQAKRDKGIKQKQSMTSRALSSLSQAITILLASDNKNPELLRLLMDTAYIVSDVQHCDSVSRRSYILSKVKKEVKHQLEKTKIEKMLFGSNTIKSARTISKSGEDRSASTMRPVLQAAVRTTGTVGASCGPRHLPPAPTDDYENEVFAYRTSSCQPHMRYRR